jgi:hypothetical protein
VINVVIKTVSPPRIYRQSDPEQIYIMNMEELTVSLLKGNLSLIPKWDKCFPCIYYVKLKMGTSDRYESGIHLLRVGFKGRDMRE